MNIVQHVDRTTQPHQSHEASDTKHGFFATLKQLGKQLPPSCACIPSIPTHQKSVRGVGNLPKRNTFLASGSKSSTLNNKLNALIKAKVLIPFELNGKQLPILDIGGRKMVMARVTDQVHIPFYLSTGKGKKEEVASKKWYPFFGIGTSATSGPWLIKGHTESSISAYYHSPKLAHTAKQLDKDLGDISKQQTTEIKFKNPITSDRAENRDIQALKTFIQQTIDSKINNAIDTGEVFQKNHTAGSIPSIATQKIHQIIDNIERQNIEHSPAE